MSLNLSSLLGGGLLLKQQLITANGDWVRPERMAGSTVWLTMIGGGSSGTAANPARGGNGGQYCINLPVNIGAAASVSCTIGNGGANASSTAANAGNSGGTSSFGAFVSVLGGSAPPAAPNAFGAYGGQGKTSGSADQFNNGSDTPLGYGGRIANSSRAGGGGGVGLGISPPSASSGSDYYGAQGYGAGGTGSAGITSVTAGVGGCILVEWPEFI